ncbi:hypothetical protein RSC3_03695 [Bacillus paralicheniformis]|nr:hypothetical protein RSC3_03695 [Bacillus paralicheniformis]
MEYADILSINVGKPEAIQFQNKAVSTGIYKKPASGPIFLSSTNFAGTGRGISFIMVARKKQCVSIRMNIISFGKRNCKESWNTEHLAKI